MKSRIWTLAVMTVFTAMVAVPAHVHGVQTAAPADQHADHHPGQANAPDKVTVPAPQANMMTSMMASNAKLDALVKKMNTAKGAAKTDAIAELLTAIVQEHHTMQASMMTNMSNMMNMMGSTGGHGDAGSSTPNK
jgi:hypothetical protein